MATNQLTPDYLRSVLRRYCHVEVYGSGDWRAALDRELHHPGFPDRAAEFQNELAEAILCDTITPAEYEKLTGEEFDTREDLNRWLRGLWRELYGDQTPSLPAREGTAG